MPAPLPTPTLTLGVAAGLAAAFLSSVSFLVSRHHGTRGRGTSLRVLVLAHLLMGGTCLPITWLLWPAHMAPIGDWLPPLAGSTATYMLGQSLIFAALRRADASRISPLLGLKIAMLAAVSTSVLNAVLDLRQWVAVGLTLVAAALLQRGGAIPRAALGIVLAACASFASSDICIVRLIDALQHGSDATGQPLGRLHAGVLGMSITYVLCGLTALAAVATGGVRPQDRRDWIGGVQYGATWLLGMAALYTCFGYVGVVFGNILQSTRGLMSIAIGAGLAHAGWHDLESHVSGRTLARRILAAALMTAAIAIYCGLAVAGGPEPAPVESSDNAGARAPAAMGPFIWSAQTHHKQSCRLWKSFTIPPGTTIEAATLRVHADNGCIVMLDGRELGAVSDYRFTTEYDVRDVLSSGRHAIAIRGFNEEGPAGVAVSLEVDVAEGEPIVVVSDTSWRVVPAAETGWERRLAPATHWTHAIEVGEIGASPWTSLPTRSFKVIVPSPAPVQLWQRGWFQALLAAAGGTTLVVSLALATRLAAQSRARQLLDRERARIARDIHDELGAGITQLVLEGEVARTQLAADSEPHRRLAALCDRARGLATTMDELVWAVNSRRDTLRDFVAFACKHVRRFLEPTTIRCRLDVDPHLPDVACDLPVRRTLLLAVKEAVTNAARHSGAGQLCLRVTWRPPMLVVTVEDDGRGFDLAAASTGGNGLSNLRDRLHDIGGTTRIITSPGAGCRIDFEVPRAVFRSRAIPEAIHHDLFVTDAARAAADSRPGDGHQAAP